MFIEIYNHSVQCVWYVHVPLLTYNVLKSVVVCSEVCARTIELYSLLTLHPTYLLALHDFQRLFNSPLYSEHFQIMHLFGTLRVIGRTRVRSISLMSDYQIIKLFPKYGSRELMALSQSFHKG